MNEKHKQPMTIRNADDKKFEAQGHTGNTQISNLVEFEILVGSWERAAVGSYYGTCYQTKLS